MQKASLLKMPHLRSQHILIDHLIKDPCSRFITLIMVQLYFRTPQQIVSMLKGPKKGRYRSPFRKETLRFCKRHCTKVSTNKPGLRIRMK